MAKGIESRLDLLQPFLNVPRGERSDLFFKISRKAVEVAHGLTGMYKDAVADIPTETPNATR